MLVPLFLPYIAPFLPCRHNSVNLLPTYKWPSECDYEFALAVVSFQTHRFQNELAGKTSNFSQTTVLLVICHLVFLVFAHVDTFQSPSCRIFIYKLTLSCNRFRQHYTYQEKVAFDVALSTTISCCLQTVWAHCRLPSSNAKPSFENQVNV